MDDRRQRVASRDISRDTARQSGESRESDETRWIDDARRRNRAVIQAAAHPDIRALRDVVLFELKKIIDPKLFVIR